ncbi:hypothetical protein NQ318_008806 [Aromia moschata]|uniref:Uncharacterized protein n=1 Tax=Aromia moschata TaxID=1265417 RepID=A0AAV8ZCQ4_9CUCU|nr:hypothetical protein NQ318_008806 [Aromia moschata]
MVNRQLKVSVEENRLRLEPRVVNFAQLEMTEDTTRTIKQGDEHMRNLDTAQRILLQNFNTSTEPVFFQEPRFFGGLRHSQKEERRLKNHTVEGLRLREPMKMSIVYYKSIYCRKIFITYVHYFCLLSFPKGNPKDKIDNNESGVYEISFKDWDQNIYRELTKLIKETSQTTRNGARPKFLPILKRPPEEDRELEGSRKGELRPGGNEAVVECGRFCAAAVLEHRFNRVKLALCFGKYIYVNIFHLFFQTRILFGCIASLPP